MNKRQRKKAERQMATLEAMAAGCHDFNQASVGMVDALAGLHGAALELSAQEGQRVTEDMARRWTSRPPDS